MKRSTFTGLTIAVTVGLAAAAMTSTYAAAPAHHTSKATPTAYALAAFGYGTRVVGGSIPAGSDRSAFQVINCTNKAGLDKSNTEANVDLGDFALSGVKTHVWTTNKGGTVSSWARHTIANVDVLHLATADLAIHGITATAHTWHDSSGFHAETQADITKIVLTPDGGVSVELPIPQPGDTLHIPGVGTLALGALTTTQNKGGAFAELDAVQLHVTVTDTTVYLAHARSSIDSGVKQHLFSGQAAATEVDVLSGTVTSDDTPHLVMPCEGTGGKTNRKAIAHADVAGIDAKALAVAENASSNGQNAKAWERASVARVDLGQQLVIKGVVAQATATRDGQKLTTSSDGTTLAKVFFEGQRLTLPSHGALSIPGVAKITTRVVKHIVGGLDVTAVHVDLLSGNVASVDLGHVRVRITKSGL